VQKKTYFSLPRLCPTWLTIHRGRALRPTGRTGTKMWCHANGCSAAVAATTAVLTAPRSRETRSTRRSSSSASSSATSCAGGSCQSRHASGTLPQAQSPSAGSASSSSHRRELPRQGGQMPSPYPKSACMHERCRVADERGLHWCMAPDRIMQGCACMSSGTAAFHLHSHPSSFPSTASYHAHAGQFCLWQSHVRPPTHRAGLAVSFWAAAGSGTRHTLPGSAGLAAASHTLARKGAHSVSLCRCVALTAQRLDDLQHLWTSRARSAPDGGDPTAGAWPARQHHTLYDCGKKGWRDSSSSVAGARPAQALLAPRAGCWRQKPYVRSPPAPVRQMTYSCARCELVAPATTQPGCSAQAGPHLRRVPRAAAPARKAKGGECPGDGRVARLVAVEALNYQAVMHLRGALWLGSVRTVAALYHQSAVLMQSIG